jgi:WD40 repeat protein
MHDQPLLPDRSIGSGFHGVLFSPVGSRIVSCCDGSTVTLSDSSTGAKLHVLNHVKRLTDLGFSFQGTSLVLREASGQFHFWDEDRGLRPAEDTSDHQPAMPYGSAVLSPRKPRDVMHIWDISYTDIEPAGFESSAPGSVRRGSGDAFYVMHGQRSYFNS